MEEEVVYTSPRTSRSLWQTYCVYADRVELGTVLAGRLILPLDQVVSARVSGPLWGGIGLSRWWRHIKLDWADFRPHVVLEKSGGWFRYLHFCPNDPSAFVAAVERAQAGHRPAGGVLPGV